jgi:hypothetical protein
MVAAGFSLRHWLVLQTCLSSEKYFPGHSRLDFSPQQGLS